MKKKFKKGKAIIPFSLSIQSRNCFWNQIWRYPFIQKKKIWNFWIFWLVQFVIDIYLHSTQKRIFKAKKHHFFSPYKIKKINLYSIHPPTIMDWIKTNIKFIISIFLPFFFSVFTAFFWKKKKKFIKNKKIHLYKKVWIWFWFCMLYSIGKNSYFSYLFFTILIDHFQNSNYWHPKYHHF